MYSYILWCLVNVAFYDFRSSYRFNWPVGRSIWHFKYLWWPALHRAILIWSNITCLTGSYSVILLIFVSCVLAYFSYSFASLIWSLNIPSIALKRCPADFIPSSICFAAALYPFSWKIYINLIRPRIILNCKLSFLLNENHTKSFAWKIFDSHVFSTPKMEKSHWNIYSRILFALLQVIYIVKCRLCFFFLWHLCIHFSALLVWISGQSRSQNPRCYQPVGDSAKPKVWLL